MERAEFEKELTKTLFALIIFFSLIFIIILELRTLPSAIELNNYTVEQSVFQQYVKPQARTWELNIGNHYLSWIENVILHVSCLWGMMCCIDLVFLLKRKII